ncbi:MAG: tail fiber domain-containing protein, partial [Bdellovibrio sp.]
PQNFLHVKSTSENVGIRVEGGTSSKGTEGLELLNDTGYFWNFGILGSASNLGDPNSLQFFDNNAGKLRMLINSSGNVGIGANSPSHNLTVGDGTSAVDVGLNSSGDVWYYMTKASTDQFALGYRTSTDSFNIASWTGSFTDRLTVQRATGNVGIGVTNPTYLLQLSTDSAAKPGTSTWTIASDERLKNIRAPFNRGLASIEGIKPIYFNYKKNNPLGLPSDKEYVGIKAQDALKTVPEAVSQDDKGYYHVTNDAIIWTVLNAVKELYHKWLDDSSLKDRQIASKADKTDVEDLQAENAQLKANDSAKEQKINKLEQQNTQIKQENAAIKAYLCGKDPSAAFCH